MSHHSPDSDDLPDPLKGHLAELFRADVQPSPTVDQAVLSRARAHFAGRRRGLLLRRVAGAAAAVAAIVVACTFALHKQAPTQTVVATTPAAADHWTPDGDANNDGLVDVRDALLLARKVDAGNAKWTRWEDLNRDKVIDRNDVEAVARLVVRLDRGAVR